MRHIVFSRHEHGTSVSGSHITAKAVAAAGIDCRRFRR